MKIYLRVVVLPKSSLIIYFFIYFLLFLFLIIRGKGNYVGSRIPLSHAPITNHPKWLVFALRSSQSIVATLSFANVTRAEASV